MFGPIIAGLGGLFKASSIGAGAKAVLGGVASGVLGNHFDAAKQRESYNFLDSRGLTPQEIAGSGAAGQGQSGVGQVLGNQFNALQSQRVQHAYEAAERDKDRAVAMRAQDTAAQATVTSAGISAAPAMEMLPFNQDLNRLQQALTSMQTMVGVDSNARQHLASARNVLEAYLASPTGSPQRAMYANQLKAIAIENAGGMLGDVLRMFNPARTLGSGTGASGAPSTLGRPSPAPSTGPSRNSRGLTPSQRIEGKNYGHVIE